MGDRGLPLSLPHPAVCLLLGYLCLGRNREGLRVPEAPVAWLPSVPLWLWRERFCLKHGT